MTKEELDKLKEYNKKTIDSKGIVMPDRDSFDRKVKMAIALWPQINKEGKIDYLFGKGVGVELALLGKVLGREKNGYDFPIRTHSDFEIYSCNGYFEIPESNDFRYVFGSMETYPKTYTKGLHDMPEDLMDTTYEIVEYQECRYLVPQLELLFLDKYMKKESTPRNEGYDASLLLRQYKLDLDKIIFYFNEYVKKYELSNYIKSVDNSYQIIGSNLIRLYDNCKDLLKEDDIAPTFENISAKVNEMINQNRRFNANISGVNTMLCPSNIEFIEKDGKITVSEKTMEEINNNVLLLKKEKEKKLDLKLQDIIDEYNKLYLNEVSLK